MTLALTVTSARCQSRDPSPLPGWVSFVEDHDLGDCEPDEPCLRTFVLVIGGSGDHDQVADTSSGHERKTAKSNAVTAGACSRDDHAGPPPEGRRR